MTAISVSSSDLVPIRRVGQQPPGAYDEVPVQALIGLPDDSGAKNNLSTLGEEQYLGIRTTKLTLTNLPVSIVSVTTGNGVGGTKIYDFPLGWLKRLGCRALLTFSIASAKQADFTDATPEGDVGIGTVAPANADALGTDATDDDWGTALALTFSSFAVATPVAVASEADGVHDGSATAKDLYLNMLIDAADIDNDVTTEILVSGYVWFTWLIQNP